LPSSYKLAFIAEIVDMSGDALAMIGIVRPLSLVLLTLNVGKFTISMSVA